ncbi:MAG: DNA mismatch repair protein MutS [Clostridiales bacterium]|nr:DNA mismatch repair protein MutS [Clostridiales bacterium]
MMQQYLSMKDEHRDQILMFRLGDFYEMFFDDAVTASRELELTLTGRDCGLPDRAPMCGVPYHSVENYIARLVKKGYKVAICEQMENPALAKGMVKRDIVRVVTPGTLMEANMLEEGSNNYICSLCPAGERCGLAFADISTGSVLVTEVSGEMAAINELGKYAPHEVIYAEELPQLRSVVGFLKDRLCCAAQAGDRDAYTEETAKKLVTEQFGEDTVTRLAGTPLAVRALGGLMAYLKVTQFTGLERLLEAKSYLPQEYMRLDVAARRNLELTETMRSREKRGTLFWVLDKTKTSMGRRLLRSSIEQPLLSVNAINRRLNAVTELTRNSILISELAAALDGVYDLERLMTRVVYGNPPVKDMIALGATTARLPAIKELLGEVQCALLREIEQNIDPLEDVARLIGSAIDPDSDIPLKEGGVIREGYDKQLDEARHLSKDIRGILAEIEEREKDATGIRTLRIGYNRVFGYYIEVSNSFKDQVPAHYIRKQTLTNAERYITEEIKELEERVLHAQQEAIDRASELYEQVRATVAAELPRIQQTAAAVAGLDMLCGLATVALNNNYCCPTVDLSDEIEISEGRHPVVEQLLDGVPFVPNDTKLNNRENQIAVLTGPNMAGKSTYMRQVALIVLMAQVGSFVPAASARIGIVDGIYTRVGASDDLTTGQSTFMVEMSEVANILKEATEKSLLILDEIGRGTSTYDGMSIARAVIEYIADRKKLGAKTLFATHYHELTELEELIPCVKNYNVAVKKRGEDIVFLRRIIPGGVDESYGIEVSKLAGIPRWVIDRAYEVLSSLEEGQTVSEVKVKTRAKPREESEQLYFIDEKAEAIKKRLRGADPNTLTPIEALNLIYELKKLL